MAHQENSEKKIKREEEETESEVCAECRERRAAAHTVADDILAAYILMKLNRDYMYLVKKLQDEVDSAKTSAEHDDSKKTDEETPKKSKTKDKSPKSKLECDDSDETLEMLLKFEFPELPAVAGIGVDGMEICSDPFWKQLTTTDMQLNQNRLTMKKQAVIELLFPLLNNDEKPDIEGVDVSVFGPDGREFDMKFKLWAKKIYVLNAGWKSFFLNYDLKEHQDFVIIWMFRRRETNKICFVIVPKRFPISNALSSRIQNQVFGAPRN